MVHDYQSRLSPYVKASHIELKVDASGRDKRTSQKAIDPIYKKSTGDFVIVLDERGFSFSSTDFASKLKIILEDPRIKTLKLVIGPPYGFDDVSLKSSDMRWSLSPLTLPSDVAWLITWEQLYRAFSILNGSSYHHE